MFGVPCRRSGSGPSTLTEVRKWLEDAPGGPQVVGDPLVGLEVIGGPSQRSGSGWGTLRDVQKWSVDPPTGSKVVGGPSHRSGNGRETLP